MAAKHTEIEHFFVGRKSQKCQNIVQKLKIHQFLVKKLET